MLDSIVNKPNHIVERQKFWQTPSERPLFMRTPKDRFGLALYTVASLTVLGTTLYGLGQMSFLFVSFLLVLLSYPFSSINRVSARNPFDHNSVTFTNSFVCEYTENLNQ
ncbi:hypothetical protein BKA69DRAFT_635591 [Paraphysoderma sedebokerense]|nr:hypothetical protein BKA69DRAFT_635591 [Paraphysoderma sedebokerense]